MQVSSAVSFADTVRDANRKYDTCFVLSTDPGACPIGSFIGSVAAGQKVLCIVGPEGGLSAEELQVAVEIGCEQISLGKSILRVETAAVAAAAIICCTV